MESKIPQKNENISNDYKFDDETIKSIISTTNSTSNGCLNMLVLGGDGTGKSGIVVDYCSNLPRTTLIIDLDGGNMPLIKSYHKDNKNLKVINPLQTKESIDGTEIDYKKTMAFIKALVRYTKSNYTEFSAIVLDGLSTLLRHAEYQMRIDKNINLDGGVNQKYWLNRNKNFIEILELIKSIDDSVHKFYIGHEDFIVDVNDPKTAAVKLKTNQLIHQRVECSRRKDMGNVEFVANITKSKYQSNKEGKEVKFCIVSDGKVKWNTKDIFDGLY